MKIVVLDGAQLNPGDLSWENLKKLGTVEIYAESSEEEVMDRCQGAEVLITNKVPFDQKRIQALPNLKCIVVSATGYNIIDTKAAAEHHVIVCNAPSYSNESVAQHVFALIFAIFNQVEQYADEVRNGKWSSAGDWSYTNEPIQNIKGKTLGILGFGQIGQRVAEIGMAFGMKVISHHKHPKRDAKPHVGFVDIETLFETSDILSLHVPLTEATKHIVNQDRLSVMKKSAVLINTGRGPLVDEFALANTLKRNLIRAAGLDVLSNEPPEVHHPLYECKNCFITPHIAWAGVGARQNLMDIVVKNVRKFKDGEPIHVVQ
ncbi:D-2-hydroxyacid dehydrogenase [Portibacter marinus]|uniref:D-2-hydroxyacid dehydrogenase n=1 Tax=Portibacter marinus TaxID=2898660 RepID=UPI001F283027|nr:D-2-hydroxyacid dehydrogenase [Portibacter marinus]